jgi:hypothetical protein
MSRFGSFSPVHILTPQLREERGDVGGTEDRWLTDCDVFDRGNRGRSSGMDRNSVGRLETC